MRTGLLGSKFRGQNTAALCDPGWWPNLPGLSSLPSSRARSCTPELQDQRRSLKMQLLVNFMTLAQPLPTELPPSLIEQSRSEATLKAAWSGAGPPPTISTPCPSHQVGGSDA